MSAVDDCDSWEDDSNCEVVNPSAAALIEALRAFGYTVSTSIADLLDNSVAAGAKRIWIDFNWDGPNTHVTVLDDGYGMAEAVLRSAMKVGSKNPLEQRSPKDLGRFGLGLKTASFAQARSLTVASKIAERDSIAIRRWDLDFVEEVDEWVLRSDVRPEAAHLLDQLKALTDAVVTGLPQRVTVFFILMRVVIRVASHKEFVVKHVDWSFISRDGFTKALHNRRQCQTCVMVLEDPVMSYDQALEPEIVKLTFTGDLQLLRFAMHDCLYLNSDPCQLKVLWPVLRTYPSFHRLCRSDGRNQKVTEGCKFPKQSPLPDAG